jgi:anaerobic selenocysteine-containing dehydrogenase
MADAVLDSDDPVRAMIVVAGNPLLSIGGGDRLRKAFEQLELVVVIDLYRNATGELAHYALPCTDMLERDDLNVVNIGLSRQPFVQFTQRVVEPKGERRTEWDIVAGLLDALGKPVPADPWSKYGHMMKKGCGVDLDELRADPGRVVVLPAPEPGRFFEDQVQTGDGKIDCCPPIFAHAIERAAAIFDELRDEPQGLKLISRRDAWMMNSWFRNVERMQRPGRDSNPLWMSPADAAERSLAEGDAVVVWNEHGEISATVAIDEALLPGVVSMAHGWGNQRTSGMRVAQDHPGVNCNVLLPSGPGSYEPLSSQAHMTGIPVDVRAADAEAVTV